MFYNKFAKELDKHESCYEFSHAKDTLLFNELGHFKETEVFIYLNFTAIYSFCVSDFYEDIFAAQFKSRFILPRIFFDLPLHRA